MRNGSRLPGDTRPPLQKVWAGSDSVVQCTWYFRKVLAIRIRVERGAVGVGWREYGQYSCLENTCKWAPTPSPLESSVTNGPHSQIVPQTPGLTACPRTWKQALLSCASPFTIKHLCYRHQAQASRQSRARGCDLNQGVQDTVCR